MIMAARPPYNIILAGKYGVGKSSLFNYLSMSVDPTRSIRNWDKYEHLVSLDSGEIKVILWDTASMEKNSISCMSQSYFNECVAVIMVYKKGDLQSLMELDDWVTKAKDASQFRNCLVFSLWCNDIDSYSDDEVMPEHVQKYMTKWKVHPELHFNFSKDEEDRENVIRQYKRLVEVVREKCSLGTSNMVNNISLDRSSRSVPHQDTNRITLSNSEQTKKQGCFSYF